MDAKSTHFTVMPGTWHTLGASFDGEGTNFALFSAHAERVELCLFDETGSFEIARVELPEYTNEIWHGYLPGVKAGQLYGYRCTAPTTRKTAIDSTRTTPARPLRS